MDAAAHYTLLAGAGLLLMAMLTAAGMVLRDMRAQERLGSRVRQIHGEERLGTVKAERMPLREAVSRFVSNIGQAILSCGLVPVATRGQLETMLRGAGVRGEQSVGVFFGAKMGTMLLVPIVVWLIIRNMGFSPLITTFLPIATGVIGLILPDMVVKQMRKRFMARLEKGLPDALDMMVICA